jgi:hypothetical protein
MTFESEYLYEIRFIFKNNLESESGDQVGYFDLKNQRLKISCRCTVKEKMFS